MYESPISVYYKNINTQIEEGIVKAVVDVGINVNKEELIRVLKNERNQYDKGYRDAINDKNLVEVVRCGECKHFCEPFCFRRDDETHRERINMLTVDFCSYGERRTDG